MNTLRPLMMGLTAACATSLLLAMPIDFPPADPAMLLDWWADQGTPAATVAVVRLGMLGFTAWVSAAGVLATLATALRVRRPDLVVRGLPAVLRRSLVGAAVAGMVAAPTAASAAAAPAVASAEAASAAESDAGIPGAGLPDAVAAGDGFMLVDRGAASNEILLAEVGRQRTPAPEDSADRRMAETGIAEGPPSGTGGAGDPLPDAGPVAELRVDPGASEAEVWAVQHGDHLWGIADSTVAGRTGKPADVDEVWRYWRALIAANEPILEDNPDLIHPGTRLTLP